MQSFFGPRPHISEIEAIAQTLATVGTAEDKPPSRHLQQAHGREIPRVEIALSLGYRIIDYRRDERPAECILVRAIASHLADGAEGKSGTDEAVGVRRWTPANEKLFGFFQIITPRSECCY